jgi:hypothetical protein
MCSVVSSGKRAAIVTEMTEKSKDFSESQAASYKPQGITI